MTPLAKFAELNTSLGAQARRGEDHGSSASVGAYGECHAVRKKITTAKVAVKLGMTTKAFQERPVELGMVELREGGRHYLVEAGKDEGGEWRPGPVAATCSGLKGSRCRRAEILRSGLGIHFVQRVSFTYVVERP